MANSPPYPCHFCQSQEGWGGYSIPILLTHYCQAHFKNLSLGICSACEQNKKEHLFLFMNHLSIHCREVHPGNPLLAYGYLDSDILELRRVINVLKYVTLELKDTMEVEWLQYLLKIEKNRSSVDEGNE